MGEEVRQEGRGAEGEARQKEKLRGGTQGTHREGWGRQRQVGEKGVVCIPHSETPTELGGGGEKMGE